MPACARALGAPACLRAPGCYCVLAWLRGCVLASVLACLSVFACLRARFGASRACGLRLLACLCAGVPACFGPAAPARAGMRKCGHERTVRNAQTCTLQ
eukprot:10680192-Alexandrium_andersonii.AAC.1